MEKLAALCQQRGDRILALEEANEELRDLWRQRGEEILRLDAANASLRSELSTLMASIAES